MWAILVCYGIIIILKDYRSDVPYDLLVQFKTMIIYISSMSQMLIFFLFLFRLKQVEIQIDPDAKSPNEIMDNLKQLRRWVAASGWSFMFLKVVFIICYSGINILDIYFDL